MKVRFINLKYLGDFEYDTTKKGFVFIGENGSGKSLIMKHIRFIHYLFSSRIDISKIYLNQLDKKFVDLGFDEIILDHNDEKKEFGYDFYSYGQVYSIRFSIQLDDRLLAFSRLSLSSLDSLGQPEEIFEIKIIIENNEREVRRKRIDSLVSEEIQNLKQKIKGITFPDSMAPLDQIWWSQERSRLRRKKELYGGLTCENAIFCDVRLNIPVYVKMCNMILEDKCIECGKHGGELRGSVIMNGDALIEGGYRDATTNINSIFLKSLGVLSKIIEVEDSNRIWVSRKYPARDGYESIQNSHLDGINDLIFLALRSGGGIMRHKGDGDKKKDDPAISRPNESWSERLINARYFYSGRSIEDNGFYYSKNEDWSFLNNVVLDPITCVDSNHRFVGSRLMQKDNEYYNDFAIFNDELEEDSRDFFSNSIFKLLGFEKLLVRNCADDNSSLIVELVRGETRIPLNALSTGEFHALITLVRVYTGYGAIYFKEVDVFLHPNKQSEFLNEIICLNRERFNQVFFETHSPYYILQLQIMGVRNKPNWIRDNLNIYYRSKSGKTNTVIKVLDNGDLSGEIPSGFDDEMTHLSMLRYHLLK